MTLAEALLAKKMRKKTAPGANPLMQGQTAAGNIDVRNLPSVPNPEAGGNSTVWSMSIGTPEGEVLIPRVKNGKILSEQEAVDAYYKTMEHLGKFSSVPAADQYGELLHQQQETDPLIKNLLKSMRF